MNKAHTVLAGLEVKWFLSLIDIVIQCVEQDIITIFLVQMLECQLFS